MSSSRDTGTGFFFLVALGFTLLLQLPAALATLGVIAGPVESYMPLMGIGVFGPVLAAVLASRREAGREGTRALWGALKKPGLGLHWYVIALLLFAAIYVAGVAVYKILGGGELPWLYLPENTQHVTGMIMIPLVEEPGWRGFALPRLQSRFGPLKASLIIGLLWGVWHTMMFIIQGDTPATFALAMLNIMAGSFIFTWLYNRTKGSLLIAIIAHVGTHLNNPTHSLPGNITPFLVYTIALAVAALVLILVDREAWRGAGVISSDAQAS